MKKLGLISLAAVMASFAASADTVVTSKTYVDAQDNLKQNAITAGAANSVALYTGTTTTNGGADFTSRNLYSDTTAANYVAGTHSTYIPTMGAVMAQISNSASSVLPSGTSNQMLQHDGTEWTAVSVDTTPTENHTQPVTSGGVYTALSAKYDASNPKGYQANVLEGVQVNGTNLTITDKKVNLGAAAGKSVETAISSTAANNTDDELTTAKAVYDYVNPIQSAVTTLQGCTHTCTSSDPTNSPDACDLITINCVTTASQS